MIYCEFQKWSTGWNGNDFSGPKEPIPVLGSDGVLVLDGRKTRCNQITDCKKRAIRLKSVKGDCIIGFKLWSGQSFTISKPINNEMIWMDGVSQIPPA